MIEDPLTVGMLCALLVTAAIASGALFAKASGSLSLSHLNLLSFVFYFHLILQAFVGVMILTLNVGTEQYHLIGMLPRSDASLFVVATVAYTMIALPMAVILTYSVVRIHPRRLLLNHVGSEVSMCSSQQLALWFTLIATVAAWLGLGYSVHVLRGLPLLRSLSSDPVEVAALRGEVKFGFPGNPFIKNLFGTVLPVVLSYLSWVWFRCTRNIRWLLLFMLDTAASALSLTLSLESGPLLKYVMGFVFLEVGVSRRPLRRVIQGGLVALGLAVVLTWLWRTNDWLMAARGIVYRLLVSQIAPLYFYRTVFPDQIPFLMGKTYPRFVASVFNEEPLRASRLVMAAVNPHGVASGVAGHMNTLFVGEAYANWGVPGLLMAPWIVGCIVGLLYWFLLSRRKTAMWLAVYAYIAADLPISGGFFDFLYNPGWWFILLLGAAYHTVTGSGKKVAIHGRSHGIPLSSWRYH